VTNFIHYTNIMFVIPHCLQYNLYPWWCRSRKISLFMKYISHNGQLDSSLYWKCGVKEETSVHILCEYEALASLRHFFEPEDVKSISLGAIWSFIRATGLL